MLGRLLIAALLLVLSSASGQQCPDVSAILESQVDLICTTTTTTSITTTPSSTSSTTSTTTTFTTTVNGTTTSTTSTTTSSTTLTRTTITGTTSSQTSTTTSNTTTTITTTSSTSTATSVTTTSSTSTATSSTSTRTSATATSTTATTSTTTISGTTTTYTDSKTTSTISSTTSTTESETSTTASSTRTTTTSGTATSSTVTTSSTITTVSTTTTQSTTTATTTSTTATTITTTDTTTVTTTTTTSFSTTTTSKTTTSSITSSTTTTTSTTSTGTTTTTTTTTLYGCVPCQSVPLADCLSLQPGETCEASPLDSVCVAGDALVLTCPDTENENTTAPILAELVNGSYPSVRCRPCGGLTVQTDQDVRELRYTGLVSFGPNQVGGIIDEMPISEYRIHFGDAAGHVLSQQAAGIALAGNTTFDCCASIYSVQVTGAEMPAGTVIVVVVSVDLGGVEMTVGLSAAVADYVVTTTTTTSPPPSCCVTRTCRCEPSFGPSPSRPGGSDDVEENGARGGRLSAWPTLLHCLFVVPLGLWRQL